jgi:hypothetical protein
LVRAFSTVVFLLDEVVAGPECYEVSVICWSRNRDTAGATHVSVAELIGQALQLIRVKVVIIPENVVV